MKNEDFKCLYSMQFSKIILCGVGIRYSDQYNIYRYMMPSLICQISFSGSSLEYFFSWKIQNSRRKS
jgi:hypothetical protein